MKKKNNSETHANNGEKLSQPFKKVNYTSRISARLRWSDSLHIKRINQILDFKKGEKVLEIGCARGFLVKHYRKKGVDIFGTDVNMESVELAKSEFVTHQKGDKLSFPENKFDVVMAIHVIEHIHGLGGFLEDIVRVVKPGGRIFFIYPAEPIQGLYAVVSAILLLRNPFRVREIHCHKLTPFRLQKRFTNSIGLEHILSKFWFFSLPQFCTLLRKPNDDIKE